MAIVTFTTDFGADNSDLAILKGAILKEVPAVQLVDITHSVRKFDIVEAAYHLRKTLPHFPPGTVHVVGVRSAATADAPHRVVTMNKNHVIAADTGLFSLVGQAERIVELGPPAESAVATFPELTAFVPAAIHLAKGGAIGHLGQSVDAVTEAKAKEPRFVDDSIIGEVIHVDGYGNAITNISESLLAQAAGNKPIVIRLRSTRMEIKRIHKTYADVPVGERVAVFNHLGLLEIAMNNHQVPGGHGGADALMGLSRGTAIRITIGEEAPTPGFFELS